MRIRREQLGPLRRQQYERELVAALADSGAEVTTDPRTGDLVLKDCFQRAARVCFGANGLPALIETPADRIYRMEFDDDGRLRGLTNPADYHVGFEYDARHRLARCAAEGMEEWRLEYDDTGHVASVQYADKTVSRFLRESEEILRVVNRLGHADSLERKAGLLSSVVDGNGNRTRFEYGEWNCPDRAVYPDGSEEGYEYDTNGAVAAIRWSRGGAVELDNDNHGEPVTIRFSDGQILHFERNEAGFLAEVVSNTGKINYNWDKGRLAREAQTGAVISYRYNEDGSLSGLATSDAGEVGFEYDPDGRVIAVRDWNGGLHTYSYLDHDEGIVSHSPNGLTTTTALRPSGLVASITVGKKNREPVFSTSFVYDAERRLMELHDTDYGFFLYTYDAESQLNSVKGSAQDYREHFAYDRSGNRILASDQRAYFGFLNELLREGDLIFDHDERGNLSHYLGPGGSWHLYWDVRGLLVEAKATSGEKLAFTYDAFGRRTEKLRLDKKGDTLEKVRFVWAGEHVVRQVIECGANVQIQDFLYLPGTFTPVATRINGRTYTYHCDHRGAPTRITDEHGRVVWSATYRAFGEAIVHKHEIENPLRAPGQWHDPETGLHYNRFRYYAPTLGRYVSRDPLGVVGGLNLYSYVGNDPLNHSDPLGLWWKGALSIAAGAAAAVATAAAIVVTAPVSVPALIVGAAAVTMGVGVGVGTHKVLTAKNLNMTEAANAFAGGFLQGAGFAALVVGGMIAAPAYATAIAVGAAGVGVYSMCSEHFGFGDPPAYGEMTAREQSRSIGELAGAFAGAFAVGGAARVALPRLAAKAPPEVVRAPKETESMGGEFIGEGLRMTDQPLTAAGPKPRPGTPASQAVKDAATKHMAERFAIPEEQASVIVEGAMKRGSDVVVGGSRARGDAKPGSDIDVGYNGLKSKQALSVNRQAHEKGQKVEGGVPVEGADRKSLKIVPGAKSKNVPEVQSAEEFFMRRGTRSEPGREGEPFEPSGYVKYETDGSITEVKPDGTKIVVQQPTE